jgi:CTP:molybdopterin cytidylyltransferase MocA
LTGSTTVGLLLAAGAGRRIGGPKALLCDRAGTPFLVRAVSALLDGGCEEVLVVLGAGAEEAATLLKGFGLGEDARVATVVADEWDEGMGASLRTGLGASEGGAAGRALVLLVDLPDVGPEVVREVLQRAPDGPAALARASYAGRAGHPVLLGRDHWPGVRATATGDHGARDYLRSHPPVLVECGALATGHDVDVPADLNG